MQMKLIDSKHFPRRLSLALAFALLGLALVVSVCKSPAARTRVLTKDQERQIAENVLKAPPKIGHPNEINFDNKLVLLGYDLSGEAKAGSTFDVTMYFRVDQPLHGDWKVFLHFEAPGKRRQPFDHYGVGDLYPVSQWKKGEIVRDKVTVTVPRDWPSGKTQLLVGFFDWGAWSKAGQNRRLSLHASSKAKGTNDDRALLATVDVTGGTRGAAGGAANARPPRPAKSVVYKVAKASAAPTLDGKLDDPTWAAIRPTADFRQPDGRVLNVAYTTSARLAWDDGHLYVAYETKDDEIANKFTDNDATLWEGDVVELFIQPNPRGGEYFEFQWAPNKARFDAKFTGHRKPTWQEAAKFDAKSRHAVAVDGTVNADGADKGWTVEAAIPWSAFGLDKAPAAGSKWKANMYRIDSKGTHNMAFMGAWAPVGGDFHNVADAGVLEFAP